MIKDKANIIFIIVLIIFLAAGYFGYTKQKNEQSVAVKEKNFKNEIFRKEFIATINKIKTMNLDTEFFKSESFKSLNDLSFDIGTPKYKGKKNPFLPLE
ncbi:hypothetical protein KKB69_00425 [Patescibacteria group bacterium]|nr:hypothetical protein [Patescibacteria group bacterium]